MAAESTTVGITGARGYVAGLIEERFRRRGFVTIPLVRSPPRSASSTAREYDLEAPLQADVLSGIDILIHCAWDLKARSPTSIWRTNVDGTTRLVRAAREEGVKRLLFVSSMSAYEGTTQTYGLSKLACEHAVLSDGGVVARLGLVYGPRGGGMASALGKLTRLPVTPLVCPSALQFTVHEDDMADAVVSLALWDRSPVVPLGIAHPHGVPFRLLLEGLAEMQGGHARFLRVPSWAVYGALRTGELLGVDLGFRADSLLGLMKPAPYVPGAEVLADRGIQFRPFPAGPDHRTG